jgi:hypothetical protein
MGSKRETASETENLKAELSEDSTNYFIVESQREVKAISHVMTDRSRYAQWEQKHCDIALNDGNVLHIDVDIWSKTYSIFNNTYDLPTLTCDSINSSRLSTMHRLQQELLPFRNITLVR